MEPLVMWVQCRGTKEKLVALVADSVFGALAAEPVKKQVGQLVHQLSQQAGEPTSYALEGDWQLLYTSEKSVHGLVLTAARLRVAVEDVGQKIDPRAERVTNYIKMPRISATICASAPYMTTSPLRIQYVFDKAFLQLAGLQIPFPPRGGGWTQAVYIDADMRIMNNSQSDTLIFWRRT